MASAFGYGVGDFIVLLKLANDVRQRFVDAPQQLERVANAYDPNSVGLTRITDVNKRAAALDNVLRHTEKAYLKQDLSSWQEEAVLPALRGSHSVLRRLEKIANDFSISPSTPKQGFRQRAKNVSKRFRFRAEEGLELCGQVTLYVSLLEAFNGTMIRCVLNCSSLRIFEAKSKKPGYPRNETRH